MLQWVRSLIYTTLLFTGSMAFGVVVLVSALLPLRIEAMSQNRGATGALEKSGRHVWNGAAGWRRDAHVFVGAITQRGSGSALAAGEVEAGGGLSGEAAWAWERAADRIALTVARGYHHLESAGTALASSRRDAQETAADLPWAATGAAREARLG